MCLVWVYNGVAIAVWSRLSLKKVETIILKNKREVLHLVVISTIVNLVYALLIFLCAYLVLFVCLSPNLNHSKHPYPSPTLERHLFDLWLGKYSPKGLLGLLTISIWCLICWWLNYCSFYCLDLSFLIIRVCEMSATKIWVKTRVRFSLPFLLFEFEWETLSKDGKLGVTTWLLSS